MRARLLATWPYALVLAVIVWTFRHTLDGTAHIPYDADLYHSPLLRAVADAWQGHVLPDWDPYTYGGMPLLANAQSAWAYPPHLVVTALATLRGTEVGPGSIQWLTVLHLLAFGLGMVWLARTLEISRPGAAFAGVLAVLAGQVLTQVQHLGMTEAIAWLPFALIAVDRLADAWSARWFALLAVCVAAMIAAGFLPVVLPMILLIGGWALLRPSPGPAVLRTALAGAAGVALAGVALLPVLAQSSMSLDLPPHGPLYTRALLTAVLPQAFWHWMPDPASYDGPGGLGSSYYYLGIAAVVLAPAAVFTGLRTARRELVLAIVFGLLTFGTIGSHVAEALQGSEVGRAAYRGELPIYPQVVPLALLFGRALDEAVRRRWLVAVGGVLTLIVLWLRASPPVGGTEQLAPTIAVAAVCVGALTVAAWRRDDPRATGVALAIVAVAGAVELAVHAAPRYWAISPGPPYQSAVIGGPTNGSQITNVLRQQLRSTDRIMPDVQGDGPEWAGMTPAWKIAAINGFQPQLSRYLAERVEQLPGEWDPNSRTFPADPRHLAFYRELGVRFLVVRSPAEAWEAAGLRTIWADPIYSIVELDRRPQRAVLVGAACARTAPWQTRRCQSVPASVRLTGRAKRRLTFSPSGGEQTLLTGEVFYPGWRATSDRGDVTVERLGYQAVVKVPAGATRIELSYRPAGLIAGALLSAFAAVLLIGLLVLERRRGRPDPEPEADAEPEPERSAAQPA